MEWPLLALSGRSYTHHLVTDMPDQPDPFDDDTPGG
jgi:hypothetical protein